MQYKIHSIYYSKPNLTRDGNGEVLSYRYGVTVTVGFPAPFTGDLQKKVERIEYGDREKLFYIYFLKGGMKTIPLLSDTEVTYVEVNEKQ